MKTFIVSDHHFGHRSLIDRYKVRDFTAVDEMNEVIVRNHNEVVRKHDKVYFLGDVAIPRKGLQYLERMNGDKILIKGNHDIFKLGDYTKYFRDIRGSWILDSIILTHIPIHPNSVQRWRGNIHGHLHSNTIQDSRYFNVSVEQNNYYPFDFENILRHFKEMGL